MIWLILIIQVRKFCVSIETPSLFLFVHVFLSYLYLFTEHKTTVWHKCSLVIEMNALPLHCLMTTLWAEYATLVLCVTDTFQQSSYRAKLQGQSCESGPALCVYGVVV